MRPFLCIQRTQFFPKIAYYNNIILPTTHTINNKFFHLVKHDEKLPPCEYKYESHYPLILFECDEPSITNSEFCIFHDKERYAEYEQEAIKRFQEKVLESIYQKKPLECFGYYLPFLNFVELFSLNEGSLLNLKSLKLTEKSFSQPVYFNEALFY